MTEDQMVRMEVLFPSTVIADWLLITFSPITTWRIDGETVETVTDVFFWPPKSLQRVTAAMKLKNACSLEEKL